jgi:hypothetical protein
MPTRASLDTDHLRINEPRRFHYQRLASQCSWTNYSPLQRRRLTEPNVRPNEVLSESKDGRKRRRLNLTAAVTNEHHVLVSSPMDIGCGHDFNWSFKKC